MIKRIPGVARLCLFFCPLAVPGKLFSADHWVELRSVHFTACSNAGEAHARRIANQIEEIRSDFQLTFPVIRLDPGKRKDKALDAPATPATSTGDSEQVGIRVSGDSQTAAQSPANDTQEGLIQEVTFFGLRHALRHPGQNAFACRVRLSKNRPARRRERFQLVRYAVRSVERPQSSHFLRALG